MGSAKAATRALVAELKEAGEDHEFYPTTDEIIRRLRADIESIASVGIPVGIRGYRDQINVGSILDIGAGRGKVLEALAVDGKHRDLYAIEKSKRLCVELASRAFIIGTDFHAQSLYEKQVDLTFSNPPYSEFEDWAVKIIRESASVVVYLVLPVRWSKSKNILEALKYREAEAKVLGEFDFEDADREARAVVNLLRIPLPCKRDDAFERFFKSQFAGMFERFERAKQKAEPESEQSKARTDAHNRRFHTLVGARNYPEAIVAAYMGEVALIMKNYDAVSILDPEMLREFSVYPETVMACLKVRLSEMRQAYWRELFTRLDDVTKRLCTKKREELLKTLNSNAHVDFTVDNIHAVVIWVIQHAGAYIDQQLMEVFDQLVEKANIRNYQSNRRVFEDHEWRYGQEKPTHVALEYRLVLERSGGIRKTEWEHEKGLEGRAVCLIRDLLTVAYNLGFHCDTSDLRLWKRDAWTSGSKEVFEYVEDGERKPLVEVRAFYNGNMHIRLGQPFALALNVENGRLRGWLHTGAEAAEELQDEAAAEVFNSNRRLGAPALPMLMAPKEIDDT